MVRTECKALETNFTCIHSFHGHRGATEISGTVYLGDFSYMTTVIMGKTTSAQRCWCLKSLQTEQWEQDQEGSKLISLNCLRTWKYHLKVWQVKSNFIISRVIPKQKQGPNIEANVIRETTKEKQGETETAARVWLSSSPTPLPSALHSPHLPHFPLKTHKSRFSQRMRQEKCICSPEPVSGGSPQGRTCTWVFSTPVIETTCPSPEPVSDSHYIRSHCWGCWPHSNVQSPWVEGAWWGRKKQVPKHYMVSYSGSDR